MFAFLTGRAFVARSAASAALLALAGCAANQANYVPQAPIGQRVAQAATETEDDGLPAQAPPPVRIRLAPDDPSEPFSRNYGGANPSATFGAESDHEKVPEPVVPDDLPPAFRQKLLAAVNDEN